MLATVLGILKVIGIALLVILGLLLVLLLLLLFVPLRYKADGFLPAVHLASQDGEEKPFLPPGTKAEIRFSWLLHLVNGGFLYPERPEFFLRLAFITLIPRKRKPAPEPAHQPEQDAWDGRKDEDDQAEEAASVEELPAEEAATEDAESEAVAETAAAENPAEETSEEAEGETASAEHIWPTEQASEEAMEAEKPTILDFLEMVGDFFRKLIQTPEKVFSKIRYTISAVCDKMTKIEQIQATLQNDIFRRAFDKACREIGIALRAILPRQMKGHIRYGTGDPCSTAQIYAVCGILYPLYGDKIQILPDFADGGLEGELHMKGRVALFRVLWAAAVLYFNQDVRKTVRRFQSIQGKE